jgi:hypothetical protein
MGRRMMKMWNEIAGTSEPFVLGGLLLPSSATTTASSSSLTVVVDGQLRSKRRLIEMRLAGVVGKGVDGGSASSLTNSFSFDGQPQHEYNQQQQHDLPAFDENQEIELGRLRGSSSVAASSSIINHTSGSAAPIITPPISPPLQQIPEHTDIIANFLAQFPTVSRAQIDAMIDNDLIQQYAFTFTTTPDTELVPGDGSCLYHSLIVLLYGDWSDEQSLLLRQQSNHFIRTHRENFKDELTYNENIPLRHPNGDIVYEFVAADEPLPGERRRPNVKRAKYHRDPVTGFPLQEHYTVETYLRDNASARYFSNDSSIIALACFLHRPIAVWQSNNDIRLVVPNDCPSANILNIYLDVQSLHYSPIVVVRVGILI